MRRFLTAIMLTALACPASAQTHIDSINTNFRWLGPDDRVVVDRYDDPRVANVSCYLSRAETGGVKGGVGLAEDPSRFSIACRAVGPVAIPANLPAHEVIAFSSASLFFKTFQVHRALRRGEARAGLYRGEHAADQRLAVQQHQRRAGLHAVTQCEE